MNLLNLLIEMVRISSESGNEEKFAQFCVECLGKLNFITGTDRFGNIVAYNYRSKKQPPLLLSAHLDTVCPGNNIRPILKKGIIESAGETVLGADNKLAIAIYFNATETLLRKKKDIRPLEIVLTRQEERGMVGAKNLNFSMIRAKEGISFDAEGTIYNYIASSPYAEIFNIEIMGKAAHASIPEKGIDALKIFSQAYSKLKTGKVNDGSTISFGLIKGGEGNNTVVEKVVTEGNLRSHSKKELCEIKKEIEKVFRTTAKNYHGKVKIRFTKVIDGYQYSKNDPLIQNIERAIGHKLIPKTTNSGSDANIFHDRKIKIVEFCHGVEYTHTTKERVPVATVNKLSAIVRRIIELDKSGF